MIHAVNFLMYMALFHHQIAYGYKWHFTYAVARENHQPSYRTDIKYLKVWMSVHFSFCAWNPVVLVNPFRSGPVIWIFFFGINTLKQRQNGLHFADDIFKYIFLKDMLILINISLKLVSKGQMYNIPALVQIMAWCRPGDKPLSELMLVILLTLICVSRPQWVNLSKLLYERLPCVTAFIRRFCNENFCNIWHLMATCSDVSSITFILSGQCNHPCRREF